MDLASLPKAPTELFRIWLAEATAKAGLNNPNAMSLATVGADGRPSIRMVLLKEVSDEGFVFYTNYESRKGRDLAGSPWVSAVFYWDNLGRQVRVYGKTEKVDRPQSQAYFSSRPRGSQISAWASPQSQEVPSREFLEQRAKDFEEKFSGVEKIPVPEHWGGFLIRPDRIEFWEQCPNRLHDRAEYVLESGGWKKRRLAP